MTVLTSIQALSPRQAFALGLGAELLEEPVERIA